MVVFSSNTLLNFYLAILPVAIASESLAAAFHLKALTEAEPSPLLPQSLNRGLASVTGLACNLSCPFTPIPGMIGRPFLLGIQAGLHDRFDLFVPCEPHPFQNLFEKFHTLGSGAFTASA